MERSLTARINYTIFTGKWEATPEDDRRHWTKFPSFSPLLSRVETDGGKTLDLSSYQYIFMRWKEQYFVNVVEGCGLTIAGFYYVCFSCSDGSISGFYYDPKSRAMTVTARLVDGTLGVRLAIMVESWNDPSSDPRPFMMACVTTRIAWADPRGAKKIANVPGKTSVVQNRRRSRGARLAELGECILLRCRDHDKGRRSSGQPL
ncbi:Metallophos domain-containing protein [Psidium guajava]|nr:Metallophos domain-containing protein [Psidium guajava]